MTNIDEHSGYTPEGLRQVMRHHDLTQPKVAAILSVHRHTVKQWCVEDLTSPHHRDMKLSEWRRLLALLNENQNEAHI